jgi:hypothetical protein
VIIEIYRCIHDYRLKKSDIKLTETSASVKASKIDLST